MNQANQSVNEHVRQLRETEAKRDVERKKTLQEMKTFREREMKATAVKCYDDIVERVALLQHEGVTDDYQSVLNALDVLMHALGADPNDPEFKGGRMLYPTGIQNA